jgi:hypothetical protein
MNMSLISWSADDVVVISLARDYRRAVLTLTGCSGGGADRIWNDALLTIPNTNDEKR